MSTNGRGLSGLPYLSPVTTNIPVKAGTFYLVGTTTHSGLFSGERWRQVCIQIADVIWERAISVIGAVWKCRTLYFHTFRRDVTFSTYVRKNESAQVPQSFGSKSSITSPAKKHKQAAFKPVLPWDADIPVHDGTMVIDMYRVDKLRLLDRKEEIPNGSAVMVFSTVNIRKHSDGRNVIGMNLQRVILIARPETSASESRRYKDKEDAIREFRVGIEQRG
ncbi:hypothetical protein AcV5_007201 [Taiwanofungus camphoratus]|nr:hypothetical protein AcV5_007201 [Antrodia cinnamomea]